MKLKEIEFYEHCFEDSDDANNFWRGIVVQIDGVRMLSIGYDDKKKELLINFDGVIPTCVYVYKNNSIDRIKLSDYNEDEKGLGGLKFNLNDKEKIKYRAKEIINRYFNIFLET